MKSYYYKAGYTFQYYNLVKRVRYYIGTKHLNVFGIRVLLNWSYCIALDIHFKNYKVKS